MENIQAQFNAIDKIRIFEVPVMDNRYCRTDYIIFDIELENNFLIATHTSLTKQQEESNKVAFVQTEIDEDFSLDMNLQNLYCECINAILSSEFYTLQND